MNPAIMTEAEFAQISIGNVSLYSEDNRRILKMIEEKTEFVVYGIVCDSESVVAWEIFEWDEKLSRLVSNLYCVKRGKFIAEYQYHKKDGGFEVTRTDSRYSTVRNDAKVS